MGERFYPGQAGIDCARATAEQILVARARLRRSPKEGCIQRTVGLASPMQSVLPEICCHVCPQKRRLSAYVVSRDTRRTQVNLAGKGGNTVVSIKKLVPLGSLAALAVMAFGASAAQAAEGSADVLVTTFNGQTNTLSPMIPPPPGGNGQTGSYTFSGNVPGLLPTGDQGQCQLRDPAFSSENTTCSGTIDSSGTYNNTVCGTGTADGSATITGTPAAPEGPFTVKYHIDFVAGVGTLRITDGSHGDGTTVGPPPGIGAVGAGAVRLSQSGTDGDCATTGANGFHVFGAAAAVFPDA
jgi:hypothetical protein